MSQKLSCISTDRQTQGQKGGQPLPKDKILINKDSYSNYNYNPQSHRKIVKKLDTPQKLNSMPPSPGLSNRNPGFANKPMQPESVFPLNIEKGHKDSMEAFKQGSIQSRNIT